MDKAWGCLTAIFWIVVILIVMVAVVFVVNTVLQYAPILAIPFSATFIVLLVRARVILW